jgi:hypothetical protein
MVNSMAQLNNHIDDDIDRKFRNAVSERMGMKQGNIRKALEEALTNWTNGISPMQAPTPADGITKIVSARGDGRCQLYLPKEYSGKTVKITIIE